MKILTMILFGLAFQSSAVANGMDFSGTYTIPSGTYMDTAVELPAPEIEWDRAEDGRISLEYDLPYEIVGVNAGSIKLESISTQQPLRLRGDNAEGVCRSVQELMSCTISYKKTQEGLFPIDTDAGLAYAQSLNLDAVQIETLVKAQQTLIHEAVGILNFRLP